VSFYCAKVSTVRKAALTLIRRWLAEWNADERHHYHLLSNGSKDLPNEILRIRSMDEMEWNDQRDHPFDVGAFSTVTFPRMTIVNFIYLNSGRILHQKEVGEKCISPRRISFHSECFDDRSVLPSVSTSSIPSIRLRFFSHSVHRFSRLVCLPSPRYRCPHQLDQSCRTESNSASEFFSYLDDNTRALDLLFTLNRWASVRFD
jgi:hypothetical protein